MNYTELFGAAFAPFYDDATLIKRALTSNSKGQTSAVPTSHTIKVQRDELTARMIAEVPEATIKLLILRAGVAVEPTVNDYLVYDGKTYPIVGPIVEDPAKVGWIVYGGK